MAGLTLHDVGKDFSGTAAVREVSLDVADGAFVAVLGPSGCGKTTLLRMIAGFEPLTRGRIAIDGETVSTPEATVPPEKRRVGIVFQNYALWPHMTVAENIGYALRIARVPRGERDRRVAEALALVDMRDYGARRPASLSGGQRQRVALARCLVAEPRLVLFDEPLANLDVHLRATMEEAFADFHKRTGTTVVYITHDQSEAMALADRIAVMDGGRLMQLASPHDLYHRPANAMVASFIAQGMVLPATMETAETDGHCRVDVFGQKLVAACGKGERPRADAHVSCRAGQIAPAAPGQPGFDGTVRRAVYRGGGARIEFAPDAAPHIALRFDQPDPVTLAPGDRTRVALNAAWLIPR